MRWKSVVRHWQQRLCAMLTVLVMLFCSIDFSSLAEKSDGEKDNLTTTICGLEEHEHTEDCYRSVLTCGLEETKTETVKKFKNTFKVHHHSDQCRDQSGNIACGMIEGQYYHTHNGFCRDENGNLVCGLETKKPHEHTDDCYRQDQKLICEKEETDGHTHDATCYEAKRELICEIQEDAGHHHSDECYTPRKVLICEIPEDAGHHHTEACYQDRKELTCGQEESEEHTHTDECYTVYHDLICGEEERDGHTHTDACYDITYDLTCGEEERDGHIHTDECYHTWNELICEKEEAEAHHHDESCYETVQTLICEKPTTTHHHTAACYNGAGFVTCGKLEIPTFTCTEENWVEEVVSEGHTHTEDCYQKQLVCGKQEHIHTEECYSVTTEPTEEPVEEQPEQPTEQSSEEPTEAPNEESAEDQAEEPETDSTEEPTEESGEEPTAEPGETATSEQTDPPTTTEQPSAEVTDEPGEEPAEDEDLPEQSTAEPTEEPNTDSAVSETTEEIKEENTEEPTGNTSEEVTETPAPEATEELSENPTEEPTETVISEPTDTPAPIEQPSAEVIGEPREEPSEEETEQPTAELTDKPTEEATEEPTEEPTEDQTERPAEEATEEPTEPPAPEVAEEATAEPTEEPTAEPTEEPTEEPEAEPIEVTIPSAKDAPVQVSITFMSDAGIPEGTELVVTETGNAAADSETPAVRKAASKTAPAKKMNTRAAAAEEEAHLSIPSLTIWNESEEIPDIILFEKTIDISLMSDGQEIEPNPDAEITVTVVLPGIQEGQTVEVWHVTDHGTVQLDSTNVGGTVTFQTNSFSPFTFTSSAQKIASKTSEWLENTLFGRSKDEDATLETAKIDENSVPDGFSILEAFSTTQSNNLWLMIQRIKDLVLGKLENIALYAVEDGKLAGIIKENIGITDILRFNLGNYSSFALVRDSGLRRKIEDFGNVVLSGLMPKNGVVEAVDVTEEYEDFLGGQGSAKDGEAVDDHIEQGETVGDKQRETDGETHTIAAYDISITNDGEEYQPEDKPIEVTIKDEAIATAVANGNAISLWHVLDDGTAEQVENFTIDGDTVTFDATGFSVYVVTETTIEKILTAADGKVYRITVTYDGSAQIPEGAEMVVTEVAEDQYLASTATALGVDESYLLYRKFLDISFVDAQGTVIEPESPVSVKIELLDVDVGADKLQVVHFGETGAEKVEAVANSNAVVTFSAGEFSVFGFGNVLEPIDTIEMDEASVEILGFGTETQVVGVDSPEVEEGLEVLGAYNLSENGTDKLWIRAELKEGVELTDMESVAVYSVKDSNGEDETCKTVEELAGMDTITELPTTEFAVVKDSGYRRLSFNLTPDEEGTKTVTLDGMMPKYSVAAAEDVTDLYSTHEFTESAPIDSEETAHIEGATAEEEQEDAADEEVAHTTVRRVVAAFDISISKNDADYQPDNEHPVDVTITDSRILSGEHIELWHIRDDGTEERISDFTIKEGTLSFTATGFSVYVVVNHENGTVVNPRVIFHFIADGATPESNGTDAYYIGSPYTFKNKHGDVQTTQILSNGESLELITDPGNKQDKYFYGWYVVNPFVISGTTNDLGIGISDSKLYFTWPATPESVTFESAITITEKDIDIGETVHWSINGVSSSGTVDDEGNVHVFLAPVFERYNFINFMLYARNESVSGALNLMTRKLVALGSSTSVEVKISDIRSVSKDAVHLIFIGWEYNAGTTENPDWRQYQTVDYSGAEMKDDGKDGVYLTVNLADTSSLDLYPIFIEARWVDFFSGVSGSGATYVPSAFRESWGTPGNPPEGMVESDRNIFSSLPIPKREGYTFEGWYAYANTDEHTGEITNLKTSQDVAIDYISGSSGNYTSHTTTKNMTAVKIANGDGSIAYSGTYSIDVDGNTIGLLSGENGNLKLYDAIDRLNLCANWTPDVSQITVVYWTEDMQQEGYTAPANPKDDYTSSAAMIITTGQLNAQSSTIGTTFASDSQITLAQLQLYTANSVSVLDRSYLDDVGAVLSGEEKFYDLNTTLSDSSVTIAGDGSTIFNVYFSRKTFKLVFHIGRDGYVKNSGNQKRTDNWSPYGNWIQYMYKDDVLKTLLGRDGNGGASYYSADGNPATMTFQGKTYTSGYVTDNSNIMGDYLPDPVNNVNDRNLYIIEAKYGAFIGDKWPIPGNTGFSFSTFVYPGDNSEKTLYIWAAYYGSLYCRIANERSNYGNENGNNPDINGVYKYMSAALCSNRDGDEIINANQVHHLVAYYGNHNKQDRFKQYHIFYEAIDGTYDPNATLVSGSDYLTYEKTTWCAANGDDSSIRGHYFYEISDSPRLIISNLTPEFQLGGEIDGLTKVYSCYNPVLQQNNEAGRKEYHLYYFYTPNQYTLSFKYENEIKTDTYFYNQTLADANKYDPPEREGYLFTGWYGNSAGKGDPFDFENERMPSESIILYPDLRVLQYTVKIDPNGGVIDRNANASMSTYFTANYGTTVSEYRLDRDYIMLSDREQDSNDPTYYSGTKYYYVNMQRRGEGQEGDWGYPTELRNAVYVAEDQIDTYYNSYCTAIDNADTSYWTGIQKLSKTDFIAKYTTYPYRPVNSASEHYSFMGWYEVYSDGSVASMPFNFNEPVTGPLELRALWRLDGGYYIQYNPYFFTDDGNGNVIVIVGELEQWMDPKNPSEQLYADQSPTHILRAPTNTTTDWVFRGWRVVKANGTSTYYNTETQRYEPYTNWEPIEFMKDNQGNIVVDGNNNPLVKYYQPGESFTIDSSLVSENASYGAVIHMQAFYEEEVNTYRRPNITNLILDANDEYHGYVNTIDSTSLPALSLPGHESINATDHMYIDQNSVEHPTQILFGDFQSNLALHLYKYATGKTYNGVPGTNFFTHEDGYLLLGFDENEDPTNPTTRKAFIPAYASDSVISVTRNETNKVLYAMWEPKVYVNFVNTTAGDITVELGGAAGSDAVRIVNLVTGEFDRIATDGSVTIPSKETRIIVLPMANAGTDTFTATALNDHIRMEMSVEGEFQTTKPYGTASEPVRYGGTLTYTGTLQTDATGVIVTYMEETVNEVLYDVNGGEWKEESADYELRVTDLYALPEDKTTNGYEPAKPERTGKTFVGWTTYADIAAQTDFSSTTAVTWGDTTITPDSDANILETIQNPEHDYLWKFSDQPPYDRTLYAVWSDTVTVTFDLIKTGTNKHTWNEPNTVIEPEDEKFYRQGNTSRYVTYTLMRGGKVPKPADPTNNDWLFMEWVTVSNYINSTTGWTTIEPYIFDFTQRITDERTTLYTSWIHKNNFQTYTFTIRNEVVNAINTEDEFTYTISAPAEDVELRSGNNYVSPSVPFGSITTQLKNNQTYTVRITISRETSNGSHNYTGYDVYVEIVDRSGNVIKDEHILNYQGVNESRESYKYTIRVAQAEKSGYVTNVAADTTGETILTLDHDHFTFFSSTGNYYNPTTNAFAQRDDTSSTITFTNWRSADLTITKNVANDLGDREHDFTFTLSSITNELSGSEYLYTKTRDGVTTEPQWLTTATGNNTFTLKHDESITISLPPNKDIVITESNGYYSTAWSKDDSNDTNVTLTNADTATPTITLTGDSAVTVTNTRGTQTVTVVKQIASGDTSGTFDFTATITDGDIPFVGLNVDGTNTTDSNGQVTFNLIHDGTKSLTIPHGAKLVVSEAVSINYNPSAEMVDDDTHEAVTDDDDADGSFTVNNLTVNGTITFVNTPTTVRRVIFDVNGGTWTETVFPVFSALEGDLYAITEDNITGNAYKPNDPTRSGKIFIGWTTNEDIAKTTTDYSSTIEVTLGSETVTPDADGIVLDKIRSEYLWDFTREPPYGQTLYAVWSDTVTVTYNTIYSSNLSENPLLLHTWTDNTPLSTESFYEYYSTENGYIKYTIAKGEKVSKPSNPTPTTRQPTWNFIKWLFGTDVDSYRYNTKVMSDEKLTTNAFDFTQRIVADTELITSWTDQLPQTYVFTVKNEVLGGSINEEFDYTIAVTDELVFGKLGNSNSNASGIPDQRWGSVTTSLKNNQEYTIVVTVLYITDWGGAYGVNIDVIDANETMIKSGQVIYCNKNKYKNFVSDFKYTLSISQDSKEGYETGVDVTSNPNNVVCTKNDATNSFAFYTCMSQSGTRAGFTPIVNGYVGGENKSLTVVFTNTCLSRNLTVTKTVAGTDDTSDIFNFSAEVEGITDDVSYWWQKYTTTDGTTYTSMTGTGSTGTGTLTSSASTINFTLGHHQKIVIGGLPTDAIVTVIENNGSYTASWQKDENPIQPTDGSGTSAVTVTLSTDTTLDVTNTKSQEETIVAPTGFSSRHTPWLLLLLFGLMLLIGGRVGFIRRKGRNDPDDGGTRVHSSQREYVPPQTRRNVSCPQARLWMNGGDAG